MPKSVSFTTPPAPRAVSSRLSGLMSWWVTPPLLERAASSARAVLMGYGDGQGYVQRSPFYEFSGRIGNVFHGDEV